MLLEVVVSALLVGLIVVGTFSGLSSANRASADERAHAQATVIVQQDEERLRGLTVTQLTQLGSATHAVAENGMCVEEVSGAWRYYSGATTTSCEKTTGFSGAYTGTVFTVTSSAQYVTASKETLTCETEKGTADYIQTTSSATWFALGKRSPVSQSSLVDVPTDGSLLVKVENRNNEPVSGATVAVTDPSTGTTPTAEQTTPTSGCVIFGALAEGEVKVVASKENWVEHAGKTKPEKPVKVTTKSLAETGLTLEGPGWIEAKFINSSKQHVTSFTFVAFQNEIGAAPFFVGGIANTPSETAETPKTLFPFVTPGHPYKEDAYTVYAGDCEANNPVEVTKGMGGSNEVTKDPTAQVEPGKSTSVEVEVPEVKLTAYEGENSTSNKLTATSAKIFNPECKGKTAQTTVPYEHKVEIIKGVLIPNHLPYAKKLELCAVGKDGSSYYKNTIPLTNTVKTGTTESFYLGKGTKVEPTTTC